MTPLSWLPMPWSVAGWTTATPCLGASLPMSYASCSVYRTALLGLSARYSHATPIRKALHWLPIKQHCIFKTALLVYKFLHTGCPSYFSPFLKTRRSSYNTRASKPGNLLLEIPQFIPSIHKSATGFLPKHARLPA